MKNKGEAEKEFVLKMYGWRFYLKPEGHELAFLNTRNLVLQSFLSIFIFIHYFKQIIKLKVMGRKKERPKLIHQATTLEYLYCLGDMSQWSKLLYEQENGKSYNDFLQWILSKDYFKNDERISIKRISELSGYPAAKISKWLREIYEDIFELNDAKPQLFRLDGDNKVEFYIRYNDNYCLFKISLPSLPRQYETFDFFFVKAKMGISTFWVKDVGHFVTENGISVSISLHGGMGNIYREFALSKALFEGTLKFMDIYQKYDFEIDEQLLKIR